MDNNLEHNNNEQNYWCINLSSAAHIYRQTSNISRTFVDN